MSSTNRKRKKHPKRGEGFMFEDADEQEDRELDQLREDLAMMDLEAREEREGGR